MVTLHSTYFLHSMFDHWATKLLGQTRVGIDNYD